MQNFGEVTNLRYEPDATADYIREGVSPIEYTLNTNRIMNCNRCLNVFGPRGANGVSNVSPIGTAPSQDLVEHESMLSTRGVNVSKSKKGWVNEYELGQLNLIHQPFCSHAPDPVYTRLTNPVSQYRGVMVNRFYDPPYNDQDNIYWHEYYPTLTDLQTRDNWKPKIPNPVDVKKSLPHGGQKQYYKEMENMPMKPEQGFTYMHNMPMKPSNSYEQFDQNQIMNRGGDYKYGWNVDGFKK